MSDHPLARFSRRCLPFAAAGMAAGVPAMARPLMPGEWERWWDDMLRAPSTCRRRWWRGRRSGFGDRTRAVGEAIGAPGLPRRRGAAGRPALPLRLRDGAGRLVHPPRRAADGHADRSAGLGGAAGGAATGAAGGDVPGCRPRPARCLRRGDRWVPRHRLHRRAAALRPAAAPMRLQHAVFQRRPCAAASTGASCPPIPTFPAATWCWSTR